MRVFILVGLVFLFTGCSKSQEQIEKENLEKQRLIEIKEKQDRLLKEKEEIKAIENKVRYDLKDGDSAKFRNIIGGCGEVNAKNSYGAYTGFSRFVINKDSERVVIESSDNSYIFAAVARTYCEKEYLAQYEWSDGGVGAAVDP